MKAKIDVPSASRSNAETTALVFAWGSLTDAGTRAKIFGEPLSASSAKLTNWARFRGADGRAFARPSDGDEISGVVIAVAKHHIDAADASNAMCGLERAVSMVEVNGSRTWAYIYTRRKGDAIRIACR